VSQPTRQYGLSSSQTRASSARSPSSGESPPSIQSSATGRRSYSTGAVTEPVLYERRPVAELWIDGGAAPDEGDRALLMRVCELLSPYCLVGWDTGGEAWEP
jgi:hypothetical protein